MKTWKVGQKTDSDMIDDMLKNIPEEKKIITKQHKQT